MFDSPTGVGIVVIIIVLLFIGPKQLPKLSRSIGESAKELKAGFRRDDGDAKSADTSSKMSSDSSAKGESEKSGSDKTTA